MFTKLLQMLFVPKHVRGKMATRGKTPAARAKAAPGKAATPAAGADRGKLLQDAMSVYRQQRQDVYDTLDEATRRQIEEDAEKAFGQALRPKD